MGSRARHLAECLTRGGRVHGKVEYLTRSDLPSSLSRIQGLVRLLCLIALRSRYDFVYIIDIGPYHFALLLAVRLLTRSSHVLVDEGDLTGEVSRKTGRSGVISYLFDVCQRGGERYANAVVVRSRYHRKLLAARIGPSSVHHLPDGVDTTVFRPSGSAQLKSRLGLDNAFVVGVSGSLRPSYLYGHDVVEIVSRLRHLPVMGLVIGGDADGMQAVESRAEGLGVVDRIVFTGPIEAEGQRAAFLSAIDVALLTRLDEEWSRVVTTGKLPEYLACRLYVVASDVGEVGRILRERQLGLAVPIDRGLSAYFDLVAGHVRELITGNVDLREPGERGRTYAQEAFSYDVLGQRLESMLLGNGPSA